MEVMKLNLEGDLRHEEQLGDETDDICHENKQRWRYMP